MASGFVAGLNYDTFKDDNLRLYADPVELIAGSLPRKQRRLVEAWAELHQGICKPIGSGCKKGRVRDRLSR